MREITAAEAASYAGGVLFCGPADNIAVTVERDSRLTGERSIFVGLPGQKNDGNDFAPAAYANGCRIFLLSSEAMALHLRENHTDASVIFGGRYVEGDADDGKKLYRRPGSDPGGGHRKRRENNHEGYDVPDLFFQIPDRL